MLQYSSQSLFSTPTKPLEGYILKLYRPRVRLMQHMTGTPDGPGRTALRAPRRLISLTTLQ